MSSDRRERDGLLRALLGELRNASAQSVLLSEAVGERFGMHPSDVECLGILDDSGPITAGKLAELTGLTTGAATRMVDRLERAGYVRRERDMDDRRRVFIHIVPERLQPLGAVFGSMSRAMTQLCSGYNDEELALLLGFAERANALAHEQVAILRSGADALGDVAPTEAAGR